MPTDQVQGDMFGQMIEDTRLATEKVPLLLRECSDFWIAEQPLHKIASDSPASDESESSADDACLLLAQRRRVQERSKGIAAIGAAIAKLIGHNFLPRDHSIHAFVHMHAVLALLSSVFLTVSEHVCLKIASTSSSSLTLSFRSYQCCYEPRSSRARRMSRSK